MIKLKQILFTIAIWLLDFFAKKLLSDNLHSFKITKNDCITHLKNFRAASVKFAEANPYPIKLIDCIMTRFFFTNIFLLLALFLSLAVYSYSVNINNPLALQLLGFRISLIFILMFICSFLPLTPMPTKNRS